MKFNQSSLDALYAIIEAPDKLGLDDELFQTLMSTTAYSELRKEGFDTYSEDSVKNILNAYLEFKFHNISKEQFIITNSRLKLFEENYNKTSIEITDIFINSKKEALQYLPENVNYSEPTIALTVLFNEMELAWNLDSCIIVNYTNFFDYNDFNIKIIAHELHHYYSYQISLLNDRIFEDSDIGYILLFICQMANEGIAELISMPYVLEFPEKIGINGDKITKEFKVVNKHLQIFINILKSNNQNTELLKSELLKLRKNGFVFHTLSYYIVTKIYEVLGKEAIFQIIENPLKVLEYYNRSVIAADQNTQLLADDKFLLLLDHI